MGWRLTIGQTSQAWKAYPDQLSDYWKQPKGNPILVTGAYRTGTTWIGQMLSAPGVWQLHEPFNPNKGFYSKNFLFQDAQQRDVTLDEFINDLLKGKIVRGPKAHILRGVSTSYWLQPGTLKIFPKPHRVLIKDPIACLLSEYMARHFSMDVFVVRRSPFGFAGSMKKAGWDTRNELSQIRNNHKLMKDYLSPYNSLIKEGEQKGGLTAAITLYGCLMSILTTFVKRNKNMQFIDYEMLCHSPEERFSNLYTTLGLSVNEDVKAMWASYTRNDEIKGDNYHSFDISRNTDEMADVWKKRLTTNEINDVQNIWNCFNFDSEQMKSSCV